MHCYPITSAQATAVTGQEYTTGNLFTPFQDSAGEWFLHQVQVEEATNTNYIVYVPQDVENDIDAFWEFVGTPNVKLNKVHVYSLLTYTQKLLLDDQYWTTNALFWPIQDAVNPDDWFVSDEEVNGLTNETFAWIRNLPKKHYHSPW